MKVQDFKAGDKLPPGTYFYIQVGQRFYTGLVPEKIEVATDPYNERPLTYFEKDGKRTASYQKRLRTQYWWTNRSKGPKGSRRQRDVAKGTLPKYAQPRKRPEPTIRQEFTGKTMPCLSDEFGRAKKFRRKESLLNACEMLEALYGKTGAKVSVHYNGGTE